MDEVESDVPAETALTAGQRLRAAREAKKMSLEDVATATRIPTRHLESIENSQFDRLPAPTYTVGFAKNYAGAVGLDRQEIAEQMRGEVGGMRARTFEVETYEPADPARAMPKGLIFGAIAALLLVVLLFSWFNRRALDAPDNVAPAENVQAELTTPATLAAPEVTVTATESAWVEIKDGMLVLKQGQMAAGESFTVPSSAAAPTLSTAKPEALQIRVGETVAPPVGPAGRKVADVSLLGPDLLKPPAAAASTTPAPAPAASAPARTRSEPARTTARATTPAPAAQPAPTQPAPSPPATPVTTNGQ